MGIKKAQLIRPPSPVHTYDYSAPAYNQQFDPVAPRSPNSLIVANNSPRWAATQRELLHQQV
jgi:hypothetical protein